MSSLPADSYDGYYRFLGGSLSDGVTWMDTTTERSCKPATIDWEREMLSLKFKDNTLTLKHEGSDWMVFDPEDSDIPSHGVSLDEWIKVDSNEKGKWYDRSSLALSFRI